MADNEALLTEIRERFQACTEAWKDIREEAQKDMRYLTGDPWDPAEKQARKDAKRPCLALDELTQYTNQLINNMRQNKRSIKVSPAGNGATNLTAEFRENKIRAIEYNSKAQAAYITAYENAVNRSYGAFRITTEYVSPKAFEQEICIKRIPNPDTVWIDPDYKEADASDMEFCFVTDIIPRKEYKRKYPKAKIQDFTPEDMTAAPQWIQESHIQIAEYWKVKKTYRTLLLLDDEGTTAYLDQYDDAKLEKNELVMADGKRFPVKNTRKCEEREVCQYITNGIEILEENEWAGKWIPIVMIFGKEIYMDDGSGSKRILMSLIRLARDPFMYYCYLRTKEAEEAAMTPLAPFEAYEGQLEGHEDEWKNANRVPIGVLYAKARLTDMGGDAVLPLPQRNQFEPNFQQYEMAAEAARRAIRSAMGTSDLPTAAQRNNEKSGIALKEIQTQQDVGSFHFPDNFERSLEHAGRIMDDLIPIIYDTTREVGVMKPDDSQAVVRINDPEFQTAEGQPSHYPTDVGDHAVRVSTGPSYQSQREAASDFVDGMLQIIEGWPLDPATKARFLALLIQLKDIGPIGDQMVKLLDPKDQSQQAMAQLAQSQQLLGQMQAELQKLQLEKHGKVIESQTKLAIAKMDHALEIAKLDNQRVIAEIQTKAQIATERASQLAEVEKELHGSAHDVALQKDQQAHEQDLATQAAAQEAQARAEAAQNQPDQVSQ